MRGATRAEVVKDLLDVIKADYTKAIVKKKVMCPDCNGLGFLVQDEKGCDGEVNATDVICSCATCKGSKAIEIDEYDFTAIPQNMRKFVTGFKVGPKGKLLPDLRNKDKAAAELIKAISNGWLSTFKRDAYGADSPADEDPTSKDAIIGAYQRIAMDADPATAMAALREISKLKGYLTEDENPADKGALEMADVQNFFNDLLESKGHKLPERNYGDDVKRSEDATESGAGTAGSIGPEDEAIEEG
jgi:hypothetical protein